MICALLDVKINDTKRGDNVEKIESNLKNLILERYGSLKAFSDHIGMPYTTLDSIFKRGLQKANVNNVVKICDALEISIDNLMMGSISPAEPKTNIIAAHFENEEFTAEEIKKIKEYAELLKAARPALDKFVEYATTGLDDLLVPDKEETE